MKHVFVFSLAIMLILPRTGQAQLPSATQQTSTPLEKFLNSDGTINTHAGFQGSLDSKGYRMVGDPNGPPRFVRSNQSITSSPDDVYWDARFDHQGVDSTVCAVAVNGTDVYIGGDFTHIGSVPYNHIAKWNGTSWDSLGSGVNGYNPTVTVIAINGSDVYVGGRFYSAGGIPAGNIAKWNGTSWSALPGGGTSGEVDAIAFSGTGIYVGGQFGNAGGLADTRSIAINNGSGWHALTSDPFGSVYAIAVIGTDVYIGGFIIYGAGYGGWDGIARWDGTTWHSVGGGLSSYARVYALATIGTDLYVGGDFYSAGGMPMGPLAKWDGAAWSALGGPSTWSITALAVSGTNLFASGYNGQFYRWDGVNWTTIGIFHGSWPLAASINALASNGPDLYVGGSFHNAFGVNNTKNIARWNGGTWFPMFNSNNYDGVSGIVRAISTNGNDVYVAGDFEFTGNVSTNHIARWNGTKWDSLGSGVTFGGIHGPSQVYTIAINGNDVYIGGDFRQVGGVLDCWDTGIKANSIAKWNGTSWDSLGSGTNDYVFAIAVKGDTVYAGGQFTTAGGVSANNIAMWDGVSWSSMGSGSWGAIGGGTNGIVYALAIIGNDLYAGGTFTGADGIWTYRIAKWDGTIWSPVGTGMNDFVRTLAVSGTDLYAGGGFTTADGASANNIAKWNGANWSALGSGTDNWVRTLSVIGSDVYAGGDFTTAGGLSTNYIAKWDGSNWFTLGSGVDQRVRAVAAMGSNVYAGGEFLTAGGKTSLFFGKWKTHFSLTMSTSDGWNMVSVPLLVENYGTSSIYPLASSKAFTYQGSYVERDTLQKGVGFWVKFDSLQPVEYVGTPITKDTIDVRSNWNMIGSISTPIAVSSITSIPGGIITSQFFKYNGRYTVSDSILPGWAYWVKTNRSGKLILSSAGSALPASKILIVNTSELPPPAPGEKRSTESSTIPKSYGLEQNYPNPFNPSTVINYQLPVANYVTLKVYNMLGQEIVKLVDGMQEAGYKSVRFNASNLPSGIYTYRLSAGTFTEVKKMLLLK